MHLIDTHCHLDEDAFSVDRDQVIDRAAAAGVAAIITIGTTADSSRRAVELARKYPIVFAAVGIQPNYVAEAHPGDWEIIEQLAREPKVVAIGETGLDRYWDYAPLELQEDYFTRHVELARRLGLPFVVHCRDAETEVVAHLRALHASPDSAAEPTPGRERQGTASRPKSQRPPNTDSASVPVPSPSQPLRGVMHSFTGTLETAHACLDLGLHISFAGMATYKKNAPLRAVAAQIPPECLLLETDAPYLAPTPMRGKRNEPAFVLHTAHCLAETRGTPPEDLALQTTANAHTLFGPLTNQTLSKHPV